MPNFVSEHIVVKIGHQPPGVDLESGSRRCRSIYVDVPTPVSRESVLKP